MRVPLAAPPSDCGVMYGASKNAFRFTKLSSETTRRRTTGGPTGGPDLVPTRGWTGRPSGGQNRRKEAKMWSWLIIGGLVLALILLLAWSGRTDNTDKWTGGGMNG